jgi:predicted transcriptional regulator
MATNPRPRTRSLRNGPDHNGDAFVDNELLNLTARIVTAHITHKGVPVDQLPSLIRQVHAALATIRQASGDPIKDRPAAEAENTVSTERILCRECGRTFRVLKRHLLTDHQMTPDQYRTKWGLPASQRLVAGEYAAMRSQLAKDSGLGHKVEVPTRKRGRPKQA